MHTGRAILRFWVTWRRLMSLTNITHDSRQLLDDKAAAMVLNVTPGTLSVWRSTGRYALPYLKIGSKVRYRPADLLAWLEQRTRSSGTTA